MRNIPWHHVYNELQQAPHGQRKGVLRKYEDLFKISSHTIYREIRKITGKRKNIKREHSPEYTRRRELSEMIMHMKVEGMRHGLLQRELKTEECIKRLKKRGVEGADLLTPTSVNRILNLEMGFREKQARVRVEACYANQEFQLDFSRSKYFQVKDYDAKKDDWLLIASGKELHYKQNEKRVRSWLVGVMDSYSRLRLVKMYPSTGESAMLGLMHLNFCWTREEDDHPVRYMPDLLKTDNGAFVKAQESQNAFKALDLKTSTSQPYEKTGIGKIERSWRTIWNPFELNIMLDIGAGKTIWLSDYNTLLHEAMTAEASQEHPYLSGTKGELYRASLRNHVPVSIDEDTLDFATRVETRTVRDELSISFKGEIYEVPQYVEGQYTIGRQIRVHKNKHGELMGELIGLSDKPFTLNPYEHKELDNFRGSRVQSTYKRTENEQKEGADWREDATGNQEYDESETTPVKFLKPRSESRKSKSIFTKNDTFYIREDAIEYLNVSLMKQGLSYEYLEDIFTELLAEMPVNKEDLDEVLQAIHRKAANQ